MIQACDPKKLTFNLLRVPKNNPRANVIRPSLKIHGAWAVGSLVCHIFRFSRIFFNGVTTESVKVKCQSSFFCSREKYITWEGWVLNLFVLDDTLKHDASCICECVALTLEEVVRIAQERQVAVPHTVIIMSDNCVRECKNQYFLLYLANLCAKYKVRVSGLLNLRKAHSHSAIDQLWGLIARRIASCDKLYSPASVITTITQELNRPSLRSWIGMNSKINCQKLDAVRTWRDQFQQAQRVGYSGGLLEDDTANHCYLMMLRRGHVNVSHLITGPSWWSVSPSSH